MTPSTTSAFADHHFSHAYPPGIEHHFWNRARNDIIASALHKGGLDATRILEVGCGTGVVVSGLRGMGFDCWGSDLGEAVPAQGAAEFLTLGQDCRTLPASVRERIETLLLLDVIEHIAEPVTFMASLKESFPNARSLLVTVPARKELWSNYDDVYGHLRRYDRAMLSRDLSMSGWTPSPPRYFFHALYPVMRMLAKSGSGRATELTAPSGWKKSVHRFIGWGFALEARLLPSSLAGTSLITLAKRS